ncbi:hypothetical protein GPECTOR_70g482 [Gonium pectorale]|uniref:Uncharacterized protein n=1 Tax=Gonium pectorale TaxID=33097 RepID=A0A150G384_GONPE|nr:hypothetical protein GPECTOR_70g482 [Gonium pectorale]|eukprot:KXZ44251.1 hypothetical protein GPECTOR_70g482 [Gonium pectorale]
MKFIHACEDPFQSVELPEVIEEFLDHGTALCMAFNRRGTLLASGTKEGQVVVWDFDTRGVASVLTGHEGPVTSVAWSRNGRHLISGSEDQRVILWSVLDGAQVARVPVPSAVAKVSLSPRAPYVGVVSVAEGPPLLVDLARGAAAPAAGGDCEQRPQVEALPTAGDGSEPASARGTNSGGVALFSRGGEVVIAAYPRSALCVVDTVSRRILDVVRVPARVTELHLNRKGTLLLATCQDQRVRMYDVVIPTHAQQQALPLQVPSEVQLAEALANNKSVKSGSLLHGPEGGLLRHVRDFQNAVERTPWRMAAFSTDSEHVVGAAASKAQLQLYIWNRPLGNMERILEGPKEGALSLVWHPLRSLLLSCAASGRIYIWAKVHAENWSAFAPDFKELDENTEYVEREDEFDWNTPGAGGDLGPSGGNAGADSDSELPCLDVLTRERMQVFSSDEEDNGEAASELLYLPVVVEPEMQAPAREEGDGTEAEGDGDGEEAPDAAAAGGQAWQQQQQQLQQAQAAQQQAMLMQLHGSRLAQFPRRGPGGGGYMVNGAPGPSGGGLGGGAAAQGSEAALGHQQLWPRQLPDAAAVAGAEEAAGEDWRRGGMAGGEEGREAADDMDDGGGGQHAGRKRKVQFDEGALEMWRGR